MKIARFIFQLFGINTYIVWNHDGGECAIVDPGMTSEEEEQAITNFVMKHNLKIVHLINTHIHIDHVAGNQFVIDTANVSTEAHHGDDFLSKGIASQAKMFNLNVRTDGAEISVGLDDGDEIKIGNEVLKVLHVPGHSPGSIALYDAQDGWLISGDALFEGSIGRTDLAGGSMPMLLHSIKTKLLTLPDETVVYPGHGNPTTIGNEKKYNYYLR